MSATETVTVFRISHDRSAALGPFQSRKRGSAHTRNSAYGAEWQAGPTPQCDRGIEADPATLARRWGIDFTGWYPPTVVCGFASRAQAMRWLHRAGMWRELDEAGFVVREYRAPANRVATGQSQVVFDRAAGRCVRKHRPTAFLASA